jgi:hypothetical protein
MLISHNFLITIHVFISTGLHFQDFLTTSRMYVNLREYVINGRM